MTIPIEALAAFPLPGMGVPNTFSFSADGKTLTYLFSTPQDPVQKLYALDIESGEVRVLIEPPNGGISEEKLSPEEELRRQRARMLQVGITEVQRVRRSERLLVPLSGEIYLYEQGDLRCVYSAPDEPTIQTPRLSPDGAWIAFVRDAEIYVLSADGESAPEQITSGVRGTGKTNGLAEYVAQEEMARAEGFWWSPDSAYIAYTEVDEMHIPEYRIMHIGKDAVGAEAQEDHRYPFAGAENAIVRLAVIPRAGGSPVWMDLSTEYEVYIARVFWWSEDRLGAHLLNREQDMLDVVSFNIHTGERERIHRETSEYWVNLRSTYQIALSNGDFIWASERSGFNHLYHYNAEGALIHQLTHGEWMVDDILAVDAVNRRVFFTGSQETPLEKHLYVMDFNGDGMTRLTPQGGTHEVVIDPTMTYFVDIHSSLTQPPVVTLRRVADSATVRTVYTPDDPRLEEYSLSAPEIARLQNRAGTTLYGTIFRPPQIFGDGPFPTIVHVYGGPGPQMVADAWRVTASLQLQYLRQQGFLVFRVDNRGSARRGMAFEGAIKGRMGTLEVDDQVDAVRWLVDQGLADPARVGIFGWSYGGYMSLMCLAKAPDVFKVAVAGAPVTHWDGYDTCYTERYMGTPQDNHGAYVAGSVMAHIDSLRGKLLIIHGMLDENVHFRHTARLINALNRAHKRYDLLIFPDERHMPRNPADRVYLNQRIVAYFQENL